MTNNITLAKGALNITVNTISITENSKNLISFIRPAQSKDNQASGPKEPKMIDLLMITRSFLIRGMITGTDSKTAKQIRDELRDLATGASTAGGNIVMTYDGESINGGIEGLTIIEDSTDFDTLTAGQQAEVGQYDVQFTFMAGTAI